ncbi:hypothetical protein AB0I60_33505 [Actinosynnema sp. NPDC050436]|uniref:hypothetical protein n=1 Tax=Actinosynnema sp. NPDC050436 TaxID=3155659 RepID=UPI0033D79BC5
MFVGRTELLDLVDRLVAVPDAGSRPVLVVEGVGGSGRTALLGQVADTWHGRTPRVLVRPRLREHARAGDRAVRPVVAAVMLGLSEAVPYYRLSFERVLLAQIAIETDTTGLSPDDARARLRAADLAYRDRAALADLTRRLIGVAGDLVGGLAAPGAEIAQSAANQLADYVVGRLQRSRWLSRRVWSAEALDWFGHRGQGLGNDAELVRLELGAHAAGDDPVVRRGVDDLLVAALLADLRHSLAGMANRPANAVVLLDDGDTPSATAFVGAVLRVRRALAATRNSPDGRLPDPLTLVVTSGGALVAELTGALPAPAHAVEPALADLPDAGWWLRVTSADLTSDDVIQLARDRLWAAGPIAETIGLAVHWLTAGHPEATRAVLDRLHDEPALVHDVDRLLDGPGPGAGRLGDHLLGLFARGLSATMDDDATLREALVTLSAARHLAEAESLVALLPAPLGLESALFTSPTLWSPPDAPPDARRLHPLARYLGLRALAARRPEPEDARPDARRAGDGRRGPTWDEVVGVLASGPSAHPHHRLLLGDRRGVAGELLDLLPTLPTARWLELFDAVVATPDLRRRDFAEVCARGEGDTPAGHLFRLLGVVPVLEHDPRVSARERLAELKDLEEVDYRALAPKAQDPAAMIRRAVRRGGRRG